MTDHHLCRDTNKYLTIAKAVDAGTVWVNCTCMMKLHHK